MAILEKQYCGTSFAIKSLISVFRFIASRYFVKRCRPARASASPTKAFFWNGDMRMEAGAGSLMIGDNSMISRQHGLWRIYSYTAMAMATFYHATAGLSTRYHRRRARQRRAARPRSLYESSPRNAHRIVSSAKSASSIIQAISYKH